MDYASLLHTQEGRDKLLAAHDIVECRDSLAEFTKRAWHVLHPSTPLAWGRVLDVMCNFWQEVVFDPGFQPRRLANVPPGTMKSLLLQVFLPAWVWGPVGRPDLSFTGVSHEQSLAIDFARKMRNLIEDEWYQARWPIQLVKDQNQKTYFENSSRGFRQAVPFRSITGKRADFVLVDDPMSVEDANSAAYRLEGNRLFRETLPTRVKSDKSAIFVIMQRLHEDDTTGVILSEEDKFGYETLILPMRFEKDRADPRDWRTEEGELLFPERFPEEAVSKLERMLMSYGAAGQLQQRPVPREGGMFKHSWFDGSIIEWDKVPQDIKWVRGWDLAGTKDARADATAGVKMGRTKDGRIIIADVTFFREEYPEVKRRILETARQDGGETIIDIPQDPSAGKDRRIDLVSHLNGFTVRWGPEKGDKAMRIMPFQSQCENKGVYLVRGAWNKPYLDELCAFTGVADKHDDMVDATSRAYSRLAKMDNSRTPVALPEFF